MPSHSLPRLALIGLAATAGPLVPARAHHPHDIINAVALAPGYPEDPTVFCASAGTMNLFLISHNRGFSWVNARSGVRGFDIVDCEVAPDWSSSRTVYVALGPAGLQHSRDGGRTWEPPLSTDEVHCIASGPITPGRRVLYFAGRRKVWRSEDGGLTSVEILAALENVVALEHAPAPEGEGTLAVGTRDGKVLLSSDGGNSWSTSQVAGVIRGLTFSPRFHEDGGLWAATLWGGLLRSRDGGRSFEPVAGLAQKDVNDVALAPTWPASRDVFAATREDGVFRSRDGGDTWEPTSLEAAETDQTDDHYRTVILSPAYPRDPTVLCGSYEGLFASNDAGDHWYEFSVDATHVGRLVGVSPDFARDGGVFGIGYGNPLMVSSDRGATWDMRSTGIRAMSTYAVAASPDFAHDHQLFVGVSRGLRRSSDLGHTWEEVELAPTGAHKPGDFYEVREVVYSRDFATDKVVCAVSTAGLFLSQDRGNTWARRDVPVGWARYVELSPEWARDRTLFVGGWSLRRSTDMGETWSEDLGDGEIQNIRCAPDFGSSGEVYAISRQKGLYRSTDHGATWLQDADAFDGFSPSRLRLSPDFASDGTLFVSTLSGGIFVSRDRGQGWDRLLPIGSPVDTCFDFALSPDFARDRTAFACTYEGILRTTDAGASWTNVTGVSLYDDLRDPWILRGQGWSGYCYERGIVFGGHRSRRAGDQATLPFTGTGVALYGARAPENGKAEILVDGRVLAQIDAYAPQVEPLAVLFETHDLPWAFHDLTVRVLGKHSPPAQGAWVGVDAAIVDHLAPEGAETPVLANLANLYLTPDASYGRDVRGAPHGPVQSDWSRFVERVRRSRKARLLAGGLSVLAMLAVAVAVARGRGSRPAHASGAG